MFNKERKKAIKSKEKLLGEAKNCKESIPFFTFINNTHTHTYIYIYIHAHIESIHLPTLLSTQCLKKKQKKKAVKLGVAVCLGKLKIGRIPRKPGYKSSGKDVK